MGARAGEGTAAGGTASLEAEAAEADAGYAEIIFRLRRAVRRRTRLDWPHRPLSESELEVLRLAFEEPGIRVSEAAMRLGLARNTISTLVGQLVDQDLIERASDPADGRVVHLAATDDARRRIARWRNMRRRTLIRAMDELDAEERRAMVEAAPALRHLIRILEER
jgi:DNA-binding MarR family transcriptional regulator